ncbi:uncharacterized protein LOC133197268 [Saccostrea echinata]|uniref:uncharacterized protein LOC133197268 n=1 Tax=Saccostrea echinata TaxID=191078 RepID=UPI002A824BE3|nr:uncharacterized protein LOC133197268 [Saccostrea echinata]
MNQVSFSFSVLFVPLLFWHTDGACRYRFNRIRYDKDKQHVTFYCSYRGYNWSNGRILFPEVCEECECKGYMLSCCHVGTAANSGEYEGCTKVTRKCEVRYYKIENGQKLDCFSDLPFDENFWLK